MGRQAAEAGDGPTDPAGMSVRRLDDVDDHTRQQHGCGRARTWGRNAVREGNGAPCRIRTCGLLVRSQTLYPAELRAHGRGAISIAAFLVLPALLLAAAGAATDAAAQAALAPRPTQIFGPPPPVPPAVIARDASGVTVRAVRVDAPLRIDGQLDEAVYGRVPSMSDFIQNDPVEGAPASEKTEVWLLFDDDQVYVVARCWESRPDRVIASEMRRDNTRIVRDDNFAWSFDTFYSRRNGVLFEVSAVGGRLDAEVVNESQINIDWNPVYDVAVGRFEGGWTMEAALPFKSLRYPGAGPQTWGFQARRVNRWRNESSYLTPLSAAQSLRGHFRASLAATLVGIDAPEASRLVEVKPYVIGDVTAGGASLAAASTDLGSDLGIDVKVGVTQGLTGDFTANPDFAQVEADEQQINLTRFNLFFPEKREFFLENQGTFSFGGASTSGRQAGVSDTPILFYSRRIGLHEAREVPLRAGGRLTGRAGAWTLGALNIQSGALPYEDDPAAGLLDPRAQENQPPEVQPTNFTVLRAKRDVLRRSSVGAMLTDRSRHQAAEGANRAFGVDGAFGFYDDLTINTHWARTRTEDLTGNDTSYRGHLDYAGDRYGVQLEHLLIGEDFRPEVGFVRRRDMRRSFAELRFSPRPASIAAVRRFVGTGSLAYVENLGGAVETREATGLFTVEWENSDQLTVSAIDSYEFLPRPFRIAPDVVLPVAGYDFTNLQLGYNFGQQRRFSANVMAEHGSFYGGTKTTLGVSRGRVTITNQFSVEPSLSVNWIDLPQGEFRTDLVGMRTTYTMTPLMFASALVQYNSRLNQASANIRFRWEYRPGSELFIVYNEDRNTGLSPFPVPGNRAFIVKVNRLFRF